MSTERELMDSFYVEVDDDGTTWIVDATDGHVDGEGVLHYKRSLLDGVGG